MKFDAEYVPCDIGWEFWCKEGNALPDRTVKALKDTTCALFGAITSKPQDEAKEELSPELKDKGLDYFSPIVKLRQLFNLHTNMRPCKSYPGNPLNYRGNKITNPSGDGRPDRSGRLPRKHRGHVRRRRVFSAAGIGLHRALRESEDEEVEGQRGLENIALSTRIMSVQGCTNICKQAFEYAKKTGRKRVTLIEKPNVLRETGGLMTRCFRDVAKDYPDIWADEANIDAICMWMFKNPAGLLRARGRKHVRRHRQRPVRRPGRRTRLRAQRKPRRQVRRVRADARLRAEIRRPIQGQSDRHAVDGEADVRLAQGKRNGDAS